MGEVEGGAFLIGTAGKDDEARTLGVFIHQQCAGAIIGGKQPVITSYSIHYTKLYDAPQGQLQGDGIGAEPFADAVEGLCEIGAQAVHLVDEAEPGHPVAVGLAPDRLVV